MSSRDSSKQRRSSSRSIVPPNQQFFIETAIAMYPKVALVAEIFLGLSGDLLRSLKTIYRLNDFRVAGFDFSTLKYVID